MQSPIFSIGKITLLTLASTLLLNSVAGLGTTKAATKTPEITGLETQAEDRQPVQVAQAIETLLSYSTGDFTVRVFRQGGQQVLMNVFDNSFQILRVDAQPATLRQVEGQDAYVSFGVFDGRQVQYASQIFDKPEDPAGGFARLVIIDGTNNVLRRRDAEVVSIFNVPTGTGQSQREDVLVFDTSTYAVRVFNRGEERLMNVHNRLSNFTEINGKSASFVTPPVAPFEDAVSYFSSGVRNNQSVQYFTRYNPTTGETALEIYDINGQRIFREASVGNVNASIPAAQLPPPVTEPPPTVVVVNDAFVAAVFGGEDTLRAVQQLYSEAFLDNSARQGQFINAGSFTNEEDARIRVLELQREGFNSRLVFRDVRYR
ncbi:MAG: hypothetical protein AAGF98_02785, partial [Cyanobacteria bacterium P01_H01_bin.153]